ncbi:hypothetical protein C7293_06075 [filamentous cyanobacterium CCT1]|nr:hypothetical protein C7293_06075 [filamentous cyanobacterium CCT1]PSN81427.1 hypothetical protein C8B47_01280 [filamentous cyanobacterium CCP4]
MKRSTLFTFLYLALGVCLTAIALGYPNLPSGLQTSLLINMEAILQAFSGLLAVLILAEIIVITWQVNPEH